MAKTKKSISVTLSNDLLEHIDTICTSSDRQRSWFIQKAVENYLEEISDVEIAYQRLNDDRDQTITGEELINALNIHHPLQKKGRKRS